MATIKEHIAQHTRSEAATQQQPVADDPLAPTPIRFTHRRDADGVIHQHAVNAPTAGWLVGQTAAALGLWLVPVMAIFALASYALLRKATV